MISLITHKNLSTVQSLWPSTKRQQRYKSTSPNRQVAITTELKERHPPNRQKQRLSHSLDSLSSSTTHHTSWHNSPFPSNKHHTLNHNGLQVPPTSTFNSLLSKANGTPRFHQRDTNRSSLFSGYDQRSRPTSTSPNPYTASNGYSIPSSSSNNTFAAYPGGSSTERANSGASFRTATPDKRGAYSDAVLSELESQNDEQVSEMSKKVGMLKDVSISRV
jgi:hypothetical protein